LAVKNVFGNERDKAIFNSSRGIIYASQKSDFAEVAAVKAKELRDRINEIKSGESSEN
jgi:hypothetical protein